MKYILVLEMRIFIDINQMINMTTIVWIEMKDRCGTKKQKNGEVDRLKKCTKSHAETG